jgi:NADPH-dependent 2,4-dienoyl-CoA reductase/sulfur reductase-like enzyme/rhodanese-related sulfurtransferase
MKTVIVGGVAAGMSTAARLRRLDEHAEIVVLERDRYVSYANCGLPYHIGGEIAERDKLLIVTPDHLRTTLAIDVRTGHEVIAIDRTAKSVTVRVADWVGGQLDGGKHRLYTESYDTLVLGLGGETVHLAVEGSDHPRIFTLHTIPDMDRIKAQVDRGAHRAVVIGASYIGVEMVEALRRRGLSVHLVELQDQVMPLLDAEMAAELRYHMEYHGVGVHTGTATREFADIEGRVRVSLANGETLLADLVIMAVGVRPAAGLARASGLELGPRGGLKVDANMRTSDPNIYAAGDMVEVVDTVTSEPAIIALAGPANRQGRIVANNIAGREGQDSSYTTTQGTAIVRAFDLVGAITGASEKALQRTGRPYRKVYLHPSSHAGYYPGASPMHIKLLFAPDDGKLLGAQIVGFDGVDKRIDVLATALRAGMTVYDLEQLELAYAPPYGSAKDPINVAGFIAANLLRGDVAFWYSENYPQDTAGALIVDVRGQHEYDEWHIEGALHFPLPELRDRLEELRGLAGERRVLLYCTVGFRSYLAYRILVQRGFTGVATLAGGGQTFAGYHRTPLATGRRPEPFVSHAEEDVHAQFELAGKV